MTCFDIGRCHCKMSHNFSSFNPPITITRAIRNFLYSITFDDYVDWAALQTVETVACNTDFEILAALY